MNPETKEALQSLFESNDTTVSYDHWYDKGEWIEVKIAKNEDEYFYLCSSDEKSTRGRYKLAGQPEQSIVVDIQEENNDGCILKFRALGDYLLEIRK